MHLPVAAGAQRVEARDAHQHTGIALCCSIVLSISQAHTTPLCAGPTRNGKQFKTYTDRESHDQTETARTSNRGLRLVLT